MINEVQRQAYLAALAIENYMPRMRLPYAPEPVACVLPEIFSAASGDTALAIGPSVPSPLNHGHKPELSVPVVTHSPLDILADVKSVKTVAAPINAAVILQQLDVKKAPPVQPFALSLWRPVPGFLIVDTRNTTLALPTELLLANILRGFLGVAKPDLHEEVMRWPMIENRFVSRSEDDARNELQTWLAVENELRPISRLWLMGENAARYLLSADVDLNNVYWQELALGSSANLTAPLRGLILPSLNELLQNPLLKARLWASIVN